MVSRQINIQSTHTSQHPEHLVQYTDRSLRKPMHRDLILPRTGLHWRLLRNLRRQHVRDHCCAEVKRRITSEKKIKSDDYYQEGGKAITVVVCQIIAHGGYGYDLLLVTRRCGRQLFGFVRPWSQPPCIIYWKVYMGILQGACSIEFYITGKLIES